MSEHIHKLEAVVAASRKTIGWCYFCAGNIDGTYWSNKNKRREKCPYCGPLRDALKELDGVSPNYIYHEKEVPGEEAHKG